MKIIQWIDSTAWKVQKRSLAVCQAYLTKEDRQTAKHPKVPPDRLDKKITKLGHELINAGSHYTCTKCKQSWTRDTKHLIISAGVCGDGAHWRPSPTRHKFGPRVAPRDPEIVFRGKKLHKSQITSDRVL